MRILITGNLGYIGSVMSNILAKQGHQVIGYDIGYFKDCITSKYIPVKNQINKDLRKGLEAFKCQIKYFLFLGKSFQNRQFVY